MSKEERTGKVYLITSPTGKKYVGSTMQDVKLRWVNYRGVSCKGQPRVYNSITKYGIDAHTFEVIWEGPVEDMFKMEHKLGLQHNVLCPKMGLNLQLPAYDDVPTIFPEDYVHSNSKAIICVQTGQKFKDCIAASKTLGISEYSIRRSLKGRVKQTKSGFSFIYDKGVVHKTLKPPNEERIKKSSESNKKPIMCNETLQIFPSINDAGSIMGINPKAISNCLNGRNPATKGGYSFNYVDKEGNVLHNTKTEGKIFTTTKTAVLCFDALTGDFLSEHKAINDAARQLNVEASSICNCCKGTLKQAGGYIFKYKSDFQVIPEKITPVLSQPKPVLQIHPETNQVLNEFKNPYQAALSVKGYSSTIEKRCKNIFGDKPYKGYLWKFKD